MRTFLSYLRDLAKEVFFLAVFLLGIGSTVATFIPSLQNWTLVRWIGLACVLLSFVGANYRLYLKYAGRASHRIIRNLIDELEANHEMLRSLKFATAPSLHDEMWRAAASENIPEIADDLRTQLNRCYMRIRGAKQIHQSIQNTSFRPDGSAPDTSPELNEMYRQLEEAKQGIPEIIAQLRGPSVSSR